MLDTSSPIYLQIADQIRADIVAGRLKEAEQVMSTNQYAATLRINPATAARALNTLVDEGILFKKRGLGMFVAEGSQERLRAERRARYYTEVLQPAIEEAELIGIPLTDVAEWIRRRK